MGDVSPLTLLAAGTEATIAGIRGDGGLQMRLSGMGLCPISANFIDNYLPVDGAPYYVGTKEGRAG